MTPASGLDDYHGFGPGENSINFPPKHKKGYNE